MRYSRVLCLLSLCVAGTAVAQTTVPNVFTAGTPARAAEVNGNFQALAAAIDALAARVNKLEGGATTDADDTGTDNLSILQVGIDVETPPRPADVEGISYNGSVTFNADHTFTSVNTGHRNDVTGPSPDDGTFTGTWSLANNQITFTVAGQTPRILYCAAACRVLFASTWGSDAGVEGYNNLLIFGRVN